jgi:hypothetical protein
VRITLSLLSSPTGTAKALPISFTDLRPLPINHHSNSHSVENQHDTTGNVGDRQQVSPPEVWKVTVVKIPSTELWEEPTMQRITNYFIVHNEWTHLKLLKKCFQVPPRPRYVEPDDVARTPAPGVGNVSSCKKSTK